MVIDPRRGVDRVQRERPAQDHPGEVPGPDVDELAGPRARRDLRGVIGLEPLTREDLSTLDELRRGEPHRHAVGSSSAPSSSADSASASARPSAAGSAPVPSSAAALALGGRRELRRDRRVGLGQRVGQVAEDVGRVVELDELVGAVERPPLALGILGDDLGVERARAGQDQPLVVVVDDDQLADDAAQAGRGALELGQDARLVALAPLLVLEREVVQAVRGGLVVVRIERQRLAGRPRVGGGGVRVLADVATVSSIEMPAAARTSCSPVGSAANPAASRDASANAA